MAAIAPRATTRVHLDPVTHFALIDSDLDEADRTLSDFKDDLAEIKRGQSRQLWATATLTVSLLTTTIMLFINLH